MDQKVIPVRRALISVSDKTGLLELAKALAAQNVEILSTGGTAKSIRDAGIRVIEVSDFTGFPEILDGRVKTLVPQIHGGLLGRRDLQDHQDQMKAHGILPIDLLCVNLYPFEATVSSGAGEEDVIENIDIGGPALIRAASKNHSHVAVLTDAAQYGPFIESLTKTGGSTFAQRRAWAQAAYARTGAYDAAISAWFAREAQEQFPERVVFSGQRKEVLRYGENPHQQAAFYTNDENRPGVATAKQLQGKELSYNNLNDTDAAFEAVAEFDEPSIVIVKHANPCGVASAKTLSEAWDLALRCDPVSAFGGIIAMNRPLDAELAGKIVSIFSEVIIAPKVNADALAILSKKKNVRVLETGSMPDSLAQGVMVKTLAGGFLLQNRDNGRPSDFKVVTKRQPTAQEMEDMIFAFRVGKHVKSNAIVYVKDKATVGVGAGQMSRVDSARIAAHKSAEAAEAAGLSEPLSKGSVVASDAFFPFADGLQAAIAAGATAVIQPGGSMRDDEVIAAADEAGIAMVFTSMRHFRH
ncbi:bifunctional phosphoribosylaminoimidazolecarboxamide formyltransferase/IMP cyclohydrolase [Commensalibacter papalotli (ex Servin-Garciduenas et al. 2014)]|uniref:Bifunctional purine biosynthesis protein PurH n=1 Tax=Commensalibacter papalotli (ex Servin-Garciduenas et al. 2014) TaxID=1208583 RepID=W7DUN7_9PROT|nr:bifunctional phosphoribosylaminoimidazolecarboxamide formyltransferase/IMP cyclohydrolase [Commensalibacter papalotli (ex Servin-Garciduenas et al. 2014)]EUK17973.1 bifunctional phosphoribosylaminoimidazolecarboxamide formyltransferase/IMP cyclohydrolase [Commensalibacter papalotli (ex Servin-Garciduenas et al. 2014)]